jgi:hypothetical protein
MASRNPYPNVSRFKDRHGKVRWRFRRTGYQSVYLPGIYGSPEFKAAYEPAIAHRATVKEKVRTTTYSIAWLIEHYMASPSYLELRPVSKSNLFGELQRFKVEFGDHDSRIMWRR